MASSTGCLWQFDHGRKHLDNSDVVANNNSFCINIFFRKTSFKTKTMPHLALALSVNSIFQNLPSLNSHFSFVEGVHSAFPFIDIFEATVTRSSNADLCAVKPLVPYFHIATVHLWMQTPTCLFCDALSICFSSTSLYWFTFFFFLVVLLLLSKSVKRKHIFEHCLCHLLWLQAMKCTCTEKKNTPEAASLWGHHLHVARAEFFLFPLIFFSPRLRVSVLWICSVTRLWDTVTLLHSSVSLLPPRNI